MKTINIDLNPNQARFIKDQSPVVGFYGGIGNGKTYAGILKGLVRVLDKDQPPQLGMISRLTYPELRDSTQRTFFELTHMFGLLPGIHYEYNKQENRVLFKNGHEIVFRALDDPAKLLSINLGWFYIDQAEEVSEDVFLTLLGRLRAVNDPKCWITGNPLGHNWVWHRFIHDPVEGNVMYNAKTEENVANLPPGYIDSLINNYNEIWVNRYLYGSWDAFAGQIYPDYSSKAHVVADRDIPHSWRRFIAIDHGRTNPTAVLWGAVDEDDNLWIYREHYQAGQDVDYHAKVINAHRKEGMYETYVIDPSTGAGKKDDPETIGNRYRQLKVPVVGANNDVQGGIDKVTQYLKKNKIKIMESCTNLKWEMVNYQWEQPSASRALLNQPEKPLKKDDHAVDSLRYLVGEAVDSVKVVDKRSDTQKFIDKIIVEDKSISLWDNV
ncbi:MAG: PBSX family phage terminase large subunit [Flammeovirgaceae bacterium]|nr:PBSX family phage terminase large subunit [Flammeovirgaceae bacterium]